MKFTDEQLRRSAARMLPEKLDWREIKATAVGSGGSYFVLCWKGGCNVLDTEMLAVCQMIEAKFTRDQCYLYTYNIGIVLGEWKPSDEAKKWPWFVKWQQRTIALAKTLNVEFA